MKKFLILLLIITISIFTLTGCVSSKMKSEKEYNICDKVNFIEISNNDGRDGFKVYVHKETKIMYIMYCNANYGGYCLSVLVDIDGKPLIWEGNL
jgi:hypothetical protein